MPGHRYWSINTSAVGGGSTVGFSICQMLQAVGGANAVAGCGCNNQLYTEAAFRPISGGSAMCRMM